MRKWSAAGKLARFILGPVLFAAIGVAAAQGNSDHDRHDNGNHGQKHDDRGDRDDDDNGKHGGKHDNGNHDNGKHGKHDSDDFRFQDQDRGRYESHYRSDIDRWRSRPQGRVVFYRGQRIPDNYRFQVVPRTYYVQAPPPPGYQYGYYDGSVVAYNPTTRVIADVLDLVGAVVNR